ncbi:MAG TPA: hypothetical protein VMT16_05820 [Thermoanaerobaculia bacterium]|nr:hypothetical protein [Thermoanaerobaculia bacterium]
MDCQQVRATMYMVNDEEAEAELLAPFREHIGFCSQCAHHFDYLTKLLVLVRERCSRYPAPKTLKVRILDGFPHRREAATGAHD